VREQLEQFGGVEIDTAGDGFFAIFREPADAVLCAVEVARVLRQLGLQIRAGVHAGECIVVDDKCTGLAVHIGARLMALAGPGEMIVSEWVRRFGPPDVAFVDRGTVELRDVPGSWHVYAIELAGQPAAMGERPRHRRSDETPVFPGS
jgi:class 3 adenylate cyclase